MTLQPFVIIWQKPNEVDRVLQTRLLSNSHADALKTFKHEVPKAVTLGVLNGQGLGLRVVTAVEPQPQADPNPWIYNLGTRPLPDIVIDFDGESTWRLTPLGDAAVTWCNKNFPDDAWLGGVVVIQPRFIRNITRDARAQGLIVGGAAVS
jgi:hypothetical protein